MAGEESPMVSGLTASSLSVGKLSGSSGSSMTMNDLHMLRGHGTEANHQVLLNATGSGPGNRGMKSARSMSGNNTMSLVEGKKKKKKTYCSGLKRRAKSPPL